MTSHPTLSHADFEQLVAEHLKLIELANELEYQLYRLGEATTPERAADCQQAAGTLIGLLRQVMFRHDQQLLPALQALIDQAYQAHGTDAPSAPQPGTPAACSSREFPLRHLTAPE